MTVFEYKTELFGTGLKLWTRDSANEKELAQLDEFIMQKQAEGWEFVSHSFMANSFGTRSFFAVTFRRQKQ